MIKAAINITSEGDQIARDGAIRIAGLEGEAGRSKKEIKRQYIEQWTTAAPYTHPEVNDGGEQYAEYINRDNIGLAKARIAIDRIHQMIEVAGKNDKGLGRVQPGKGRQGGDGPQFRVTV